MRTPTMRKASLAVRRERMKSMAAQPEAGRGRARSRRPPRPPGRALLDDRRVGRLVEADDEGAALADRRRSQVSARPEQEPQQLRPGRPGLAEIHVNDLLAPGGVQLVHVVQ